MLYAGRRCIAGEAVFGVRWRKEERWGVRRTVRKKEKKRRGGTGERTTKGGKRGERGGKEKREEEELKKIRNKNWVK